VAADQKKGRRLRAHLVFLDESGLLLAPLVRRSWAPRGQTPVFYQRLRYREKVSMIAALTVSPRGRRVGLYFSLAPNRNVEKRWLASFLHGLLRHLRGRVILIWDRLPVHRSGQLRHWLDRHPRVSVELLPPYAPELNPVELFWAYLKCNPLANLAADDPHGLARLAARHARRLQRRADLLRSFIRATPLSSCVQ
jgi:transposase